MLGLLPGSKTERHTFGFEEEDAAAGPLCSTFPAEEEAPENQPLRMPIVLYLQHKYVVRTVDKRSLLCKLNARAMTRTTAAAMERAAVGSTASVKSQIMPHNAFYKTKRVASWPMKDRLLDTAKITLSAESNR